MHGWWRCGAPADTTAAASQPRMCTVCAPELVAQAHPLAQLGKLLLRGLILKDIRVVHNQLVCVKEHKEKSAYLCELGSALWR